MRTVLFVMLAVLVASCVGKDEDADYAPYPGGKGCCEKPVK